MTRLGTGSMLVPCGRAEAVQSGSAFVFEKVDQISENRRKYRSCHSFQRIGSKLVELVGEISCRAIFSNVARDGHEPDEKSTSWFLTREPSFHEAL